MHLQLSLTWVGHGQQLCELQGVRVSTRAHMIIYSIYSVAETCFFPLKKVYINSGKCNNNYWCILSKFDSHPLMLVVFIPHKTCFYHLAVSQNPPCWTQSHYRVFMDGNSPLKCSHSRFWPITTFITYIIIYISLSLELLYIYHEIGVRSTIH